MVPYGIFWQVNAKNRLAARRKKGKLVPAMKPFIQLKVKVLPPVALTMLLATAGCGRDAVHVYNVDTNDSVAATAPPAAAPGGMPAALPPGMPVPDDSTRSVLKFVVPAGWQQKDPGEMRVASFGITDGGKQADISVVPLGGMGGGDLANVNRWRGQVGQAPLDEAGLKKISESVTIAGQPAMLYDLAPSGLDDSTPAQHILGTILHREDTVWFFKMTGEDSLVQKQKPAFLAFLKSVQFNGAAAAPAMDLSQLPPSHPPIGGMSAGGMGGMSGAPVAAPDPATVPTWNVPAGWVTAPITQFVLAKFTVTSTDNRRADISVSSLAGDGGGLAANINRWRQQLGLPPVDDAAIAKLDSLDTPSGKATLVALSGTSSRTGQPARLVGVVLSVGGQTWFYKLMGEPVLVDVQKDSLLRFVKSAKYPAGN